MSGSQIRAASVQFDSSQAAEFFSNLQLWQLITLQSFNLQSPVVPLWKDLNLLNICTLNQFNGLVGFLGFVLLFSSSPIYVGLMLQGGISFFSQLYFKNLYDTLQKFQSEKFKQHLNFSSYLKRLKRYELSSFKVVETPPFYKVNMSKF